MNAIGQSFLFIMMCVFPAKNKKANNDYRSDVGPVASKLLHSYLSSSFSLWGVFFLRGSVKSGKLADHQDDEDDQEGVDQGGESAVHFGSFRMCENQNPCGFWRWINSC